MPINPIRRYTNIQSRVQAWRDRIRENNWTRNVKPQSRGDSNHSNPLKPLRLQPKKWAKKDDRKNQANNRGLGEILDETTK